MFITSINLQNLELFEFICVRALPNTSRMKLDLFTVSVDEIEVPDKKSMACFAVFVLPEPETPVINKDWFTFVNFMFSTASLTKIKIRKLVTVIYSYGINRSTAAIFDYRKQVFKVLPKNKSKSNQ